MSDVFKFGDLPLYEARGAVYAIGDVHGELKKLRCVHSEIERVLKPEDWIVFVGDVIDVGPNSPGVLLEIRDLMKRHKRTKLVCGNHEEMLRLFLREQPMVWLANGGRATIEQFRREEDGSGPVDLEAWMDDNGITELLDSMIPYFETDGLLITHAPLSRASMIARGLSHYAQDLKEKELGFKFMSQRLGEEIRWEFIDDEDQAIPEIPKLLVCGHQNNFGKTPAPRFYPDSSRIFLDAGAGYYSNNPIGAAQIWPREKIHPIG